jgi:ribonuclease BN (tRNA processing enzyme)
VNLTILGASAACPAPGGACSSYLVQQDETNLVLDCGPGSVANLRRAINFRAVTAIVLSHLHADHILDLIPYRYGLRHSPGRTDDRLPLWTPPGGAAHLEALGRAVSGEAGFFDATFVVREYDPAAGLTIGSLRLTFMPTQHYVPAWAIRCRGGNATLAYSADSGPTDALVELARNADLFLCEATLLEQEGNEAVPGHLTAAEAGAMAQAAGVRRLLLTHLWPELGIEALLAAARSTFTGPIEVAREGARHRIDGTKQ